MYFYEIFGEGLIHTNFTENDDFSYYEELTSSTFRDACHLVERRGGTIYENGHKNETAAYSTSIREVSV